MPSGAGPKVSGGQTFLKGQVISFWLYKKIRFYLHFSPCCWTELNFSLLMVISFMSSRCVPDPYLWGLLWVLHLIRVSLCVSWGFPLLGSRCKLNKTWTREGGPSLSCPPKGTSKTQLQSFFNLSFSRKRLFSLLCKCQQGVGVEDASSKLPRTFENEEILPGWVFYCYSIVAFLERWFYPGWKIGHALFQDQCLSPSTMVVALMLRERIFSASNPTILISLLAPSASSG